jgi:hypothetical protein
MGQEIGAERLFDCGRTADLSIFYTDCTKALDTTREAGSSSQEGEKRNIRHCQRLFPILFWPFLLFSNEE